VAAYLEAAELAHEMRDFALQKKNLEAAVTYSQSHKPKNILHRCNALKSAGHYYFERRDYKRAMSFYKTWNEILANDNSTVGRLNYEIDSYFWLAATELRLFRLQAARAYYQKGLDAARAGNRPRSMVDALVSLGKIEQFLRRYDQAASYYKRAIASRLSRPYSFGDLSSQTLLAFAREAKAVNPGFRHCRTIRWLATLCKWAGKDKESGELDELSEIEKKAMLAESSH
jgi:tetratricopeptide (TPR) repeat protein